LKPTQAFQSVVRRVSTGWVLFMDASVAASRGENLPVKKV